MSKHGGNPGNQGSPKRKPPLNVTVPQENKPAHTSMLGWLRAISSVSVLFGGGGLMQPATFTWGVVLVLVGFVLLALDLAFENIALNKKRIGIAAVLALGAIFVYKVLLVPIPLDIGVVSILGAYPPGTKVAGVEWTTLYTDCRIHISNPSDNDYEDLDVSASTDLTILTARQITALPNVTITPGPDSQRLPPVWPTGAVDKDGHPVVFPILRDQATMASAKTYRVYCQKLLHKSDLEIMLVLVNLHQPIEKSTDAATILSAFGPRRGPNNYKLDGRFVALSRIKEIRINGVVK